MAMHWNHRVVRVADGDDELLMLCEVFYDDAKGTAIGRNDGARVIGETQDDMVKSMERMRRALTKPILEDRWPQSSDELNTAAGR